MAKQYHKNPRQITAKQYEALAIDLAELGDLGGIVHDLNSDEIIGGNQRSRVFDLNTCDVVLTEVLPEPDAQGTVAHGFVLWKGSKYAYRQVRWNERQCEKANVVANKRGGTWDFDILADQFDAGDLLDWGFEPFELGLDDEPAEAGGDTEPQIDRAEELREKWQTAAGQLWQLGEHRLICGDCTDPATVARVMAGERAQAVVTDPPYGVNYTGGTGRYAGDTIKSGTRSAIENDADFSLYRATFDLCLSHCDDGVFYVWYADKLIKHIAPLIPNALELRAIVNWYKVDQGFGDMGAQYHNVSEPCLYLVKGAARWKGPNNETNVWEYQRPQKNELHPTEKPLELIQRMIANHDAPIVADWFSGSGTTIIACENLHRRCRACEISPAYVAVALERWAQHTGGAPVLLDVSGNS